jgi:hypothetical protein
MKIKLRHYYLRLTQEEKIKSILDVLNVTPGCLLITAGGILFGGHLFPARPVGINV